MFLSVMIRGWGRCLDRILLRRKSEGIKSDRKRVRCSLPCGAFCAITLNTGICFDMANVHSCSARIRELYQTVKLRLFAAVNCFEDLLIGPLLLPFRLDFLKFMSHCHFLRYGVMFARDLSVRCTEWETGESKNAPRDLFPRDGRIHSFAVPLFCMICSVAAHRIQIHLYPTRITVGCSVCVYSFCVQSKWIFTIRSETGLPSLAEHRQFISACKLHNTEISGSRSGVSSSHCF